MGRLLIWEGSDDFKERLETARERYREIYNKLEKTDFRCTFMGDLRFDLNAEPEIWLNDNQPLCAERYCKTPDDAKSMALRHGICGWWRLDDLDRFVDGEGPLFEEAMWDLEYRRAKRDPTQWARKRKNDGVEDPIKVYWEERHRKQFMELANGDEKRLNQLWVMRNESAGISKTYDIQVGKTGMIYVALWANPFEGSTTETLWMLGEQIRNRGHIAKQQDGFYMDAKNVRLGEQEGIYIRATRPDESYVESVWPSQIPSSKIYGLLDDLSDKVSPLEVEAKQ